MPLPADTTFAHDFAAALIDPASPAPAGLRAPRDGRVEKRFAVYRNNVVASLSTALSDIFPTVERLVGEEFFRAMARVYIRREPPASPLLFEYGQGFADFIAGFEPAKSLPYLPDVARLERLWLDAFHAADAPPLAAGALGGIPPEKLPDIRFVLHPAARWISSPFAVVSIVARDRSGESLDGLDWTKAENGLITRPAFDVGLRHLPPGGHAFVRALAQGRTLGAAAAEALTETPEADLPRLIGGCLEAGLFTALHGHETLIGES